MRRFTFGVFVSVAALAVASPAISADLDFPDDIRGTYNDWDAPQDPLMDFEAGLRYGYTMGHQRLTIGSATFEADDTTHAAEIFLRLNDRATNSYLKAYGGYSMMMGGSYTNSVNATSGALPGGRLAYAVVDFGHHPMSWDNGDSKGGAGVFMGYQYLNDSPDMGAGNFAVIDSASDVTWDRSTGDPIFGWDHANNNLNINALRVGLSGDADFGMVNLSGELAAIPYAYINGTAPASLYGGTGNIVQSSPTTYVGHGYGAAAELMAGTSVENWNFRVGGRAMYLAGKGQAKYEIATVTDAIDGSVPPDGIYETDGTVSLQNYITDWSSFDMWRYGIVAELSVEF